MRKKRMSLWILIWILSLGSLQAQGDESASLRIAIAEQMGFEARVSFGAMVRQKNWGPFAGPVPGSNRQLILFCRNWI